MLKFLLLSLALSSVILGEEIIQKKSDGVSLIYFFDDSGKLTHLNSSDHTISYQYSYDSEGNLLNTYDLVNGNHTEKTLNNDKKILVEKAGPYAIIYELDAKGRKTRLTLPDGSGIAYAYDDERLIAIHRLSPSSERLYSHEYFYDNNCGHVVSENLIMNLGTIHYDFQQGRCAKIQTPYWSEANDFDSSGNVVKSHLQDAWGNTDSIYGYDAKSQLTTETGTWANSYQYDDQFNRICLNGQVLQHNDKHQLIADGSTAYSYDLNGNLVKKVNESDIITYRYDALDRLIEVEQEDKLKATYTYDAFDRRLTKVISRKNSATDEWKEEKFYYLYDEYNEIGAMDGEGKITELRLLGNGVGCTESGGSVALELNGQVYAPIHDHNGSICCLVDTETNEVFETYRYSAFGLLENAISINPWKFSGKRYDQESGFYYFGARFYDPHMGRWITQDPLGDVEGQNRYVYACNNPVNRNDFYGHFSIPHSVKQTVISGLQFLQTVVNEGAKAIVALNRYVGASIQHELEVVGRFIFDESLYLLIGYKNEKTETGVVGKGEIYDNIRFTQTNGILNKKLDILYVSKMISDFHGGVNIHYTLRPTNGWTWDFVKAIMLKSGYISPEAFHLAENWKALIQEMGGTEGGGTIIHFAHSIGGTETSSAKTLMTPEELKMIKVYTFGSATMVLEEGFGSVVNFVSKRDVVPLLDPIGYTKGLLDPNGNVVFIGDFIAFPIVDHLIAGESYRKILEDLGKRFIEKHNLEQSQKPQ